MESKRYLSTQSGFSLLEILISLLVISIGMLGLGGLQLFALKSANNAPVSYTHLTLPTILLV